MNNLSRNQMASILNVSAPTYKKIETGESVRIQPDLRTLARLSNTPLRVWTDEDSELPDGIQVNMAALEKVRPDKVTLQPGADESDDPDDKLQKPWRAFLHKLLAEYGSQGEMAAKLGIDGPLLSRLLANKKITRRTMWKIGAATNLYEWYQPQRPQHEGERLRDYLGWKQIDQNDFGKQIGTVKSAVTRLLSLEQIPLKKWPIITRVLGVSKEIIMQGPHIEAASPKLPNLRTLAPVSPQLKPFIEDEYEYIDVPILPESARAGLDAPRYFEQPIETTRIRIDDIPVGLRKRKWWVINVNGDSMEPQLRAGDKVQAYWTERDEWDKIHNKVVIIQYANQVVIKRIKNNKLLTEGGLWLHSDNPAAETFFVPIEDLQHIWLVYQRSGGIH